MTLIATVPFASVAEADQYFDPLNHMYADEWWASATGSVAKLTTTGLWPASNLLIEKIAAGVAGNLCHMKIVLVAEIFGPSVFVGSDTFGPMISINIVPSGVTAAEALALLHASEWFDISYTGALVEDPGAADMEAMETTYFSGGVDPNSDRLGEKAPALAFATRKINNLPFAGEKAVLTQANAFPRKYLRADAYVGLMPTADAYYTQTEVPDDVKMACCEEALAIMKYGNTPRYKLQTENVKSFAFGSQGLRETYTGRTKEGNIISGEAMNLLRKYMRRNYMMVA